MKNSTKKIKYYLNLSNLYNTDVDDLDETLCDFIGNFANLIRASLSIQELETLQSHTHRREWVCGVTPIIEEKTTTKRTAKKRYTRAKAMCKPSTRKNQTNSTHLQTSKSQNTKYTSRPF